jgi:hypothetical protein
MGRASRRKQETTREERIAGRETQATPMSFREFSDIVQEAERNDYERRRGAANDPNPKLLLERDGKLKIIFFDHAMFNTEEGKDAAAAAILEAVKKSGARKVAFAQPGWGLFDPEANQKAIDGTGPTPIDHPDRKEIHVLIVLDAERVETYVAEVERLGKKKRGHLRPWNEHVGGGPLLDDMAAGNYVDSRFINPVKEALR